MIKVIGIDLTGSEKRPSGVATLYDGGHVMTTRLKTDWDIIAYVKSDMPALVSIDSPLSLPEDPAKIYRDCELTLKRRGIGVYWCLLPSMKALTMRGIALAEKLREEGFQVIESYPGAAQDILGIPRKSKGIQLLADALAEYGIKYHKIMITRNKGQYIREQGIEVLFDDTDEYFVDLPEEIAVFKVRQHYNFDFHENKWLFSDRTGKKG